MEKLQVEPIRRNPAGLAVRIFALVLIASLAYLVFGAVALLVPDSIIHGYVAALWVIYTGINVLIAAYILKAVMLWLKTSYFISGHELIEREGLYTISEKMCDLHNLEAVDIRQGWLGHRFHYGNVVLGLAGPGISERIELLDVADPEKYESLWARAVMV